FPDILLKSYLQFCLLYYEILFSCFRLLTPPGTPIFPSLEMKSRETMMSQLGTSRAHPTALTSRPPEGCGDFKEPKRIFLSLNRKTLTVNKFSPRGHLKKQLASRQLASSPGSNTSSSSLRRPSSSGGYSY
ncbi:hypothetical protein MTR67_013259, partial [Solanum verrucosum]